MNNDYFDIKPEEVQYYMDRAGRLRAAAVHSSFVDFKNAIKNLFTSMLHAMDIPRTEQL